MFKSVLLIDDNRCDNFVHRKIIERFQFAKYVYDCRDGQEALDFLNQYKNPDSTVVNPEIIFLDINMPVMNGWEFLEEYNQLKPDLQQQHIIVMLSTSANPTDKFKAKNHPFVLDFMSKPLSKEKLEKIKTVLEYEK
ncbi:response regulator [Aquimarina spongiae]|uniref:CheY chemotaxis protein or a CheY-like REC (Receiver) domain n=1 Tax=Aquimarina spongiae TaxID=570521 RepID=A0A1M6KC93_9FLAO|nr:response regulator [Aquimarina spongiae]SHJ56540.1 CheY chemotaxis protein or a CheY-like REC (receiver) domain [Aquimarina spongiae]